MPPIDESTLRLYVLLSALGCAMTLAIWHDVRTYRVPNAIIVAGTFAALVLHGLLDTGNGSGMGVFGSLLGFAIGFAMFLPFYLLRAAGAGDVKLMAMVGAYLGPLDMVATYVWTCAAGAVFAVLFALRRRVFARMLSNVLRIVRSMLPGLPKPAYAAFDPDHGSAAKLPYSVAIAAGTVVWMTVRLMH